jgi:hypothetical protein
MSGAQIEQKNYETPRATDSPSHISSPSPTSTDGLIFGEKVFVGAF